MWFDGQKWLIISRLYQIKVGISGTTSSWLIYVQFFFSVKTALIQKPTHLVFSQFEFLMKEIIILSWHYFNWHKCLTNTNFPRHKYWMPDLEKTRNIKIHTKFCYVDYEVSANYQLFSTSNLIEIEQYQFLCPTVELSKLSMRKDYVSLIYIKLKFK